MFHNINPFITPKIINRFKMLSFHWHSELILSIKKKKKKKKKGGGERKISEILNFF